MSRALASIDASLKSAADAVADRARAEQTGIDDIPPIRQVLAEMQAAAAVLDAAGDRAKAEIRRTNDGGRISCALDDYAAAFANFTSLSHASAAACAKTIKDLTR